MIYNTINEGIEHHTWVTEAREAVSLLLLLWVKEPHARAPLLPERLLEALLVVQDEEVGRSARERRRQSLNGPGGLSTIHQHITTASSVIIVLHPRTCVCLCVRE